MVGGVLVVALAFEMLDAKTGDIKTWVKGRLEDTTFINKINTVVENTITKLFSKADQYALLSGKVEKVLESLKTTLSEEAFQYLKNNLQKEQTSDLMEAVRKLEKELGNTEIKLSEAQAKKLLEGLKDGKSVDSVVAELKTWCENSSIKEYVKIEGRGSTGRTTPNDLIEEIAMDSTKKNPFEPGEGNTVRKVIDSLNDERWKGWEKWEVVYRTKSGRTITIHFSYDPIYKLFDDFKFKK